MKLREADKLTMFMFTDNIHGISEQYDYEENGQFFVLEYDHYTKKVFIHAKGGEIFERKWVGSKDHHTQALRQWIFETVNAAVK